MKIHFYNVPPHTPFFEATVQSLTERAIIGAFIKCLVRRRRFLSVTIDPDGRHGKLMLAGDRTVAHFQID